MAACLTVPRNSPMLHGVALFSGSHPCRDRYPLCSRPVVTLPCDAAFSRRHPGMITLIVLMLALSGANAADGECLTLTLTLTLTLNVYLA